MMKKTLKTAVFLLASTALLAKTQITFWHGIESPASVKVLEEKIENFEAAHPDIDVVAQNYGAADQVNSKIMTAVAGNRAPNLMWWAPSFTGQMAKTGKLVKVQDFIDKDPSFNKSDVYSGLWDVSMYKGEVWTAPFDANNLGLYYNKKQFREAGIDPESIKTWDDLLAAAKKLTNNDRYGFQVPLGKGEWTVWTWQTLLWQAGGEFLTVPKYKNAVFDSEAGVNALQFWTDLVNKEKVATFSEPDAGYKTDDFLAGRVSMMINGPWNYGVLQKAAEETGFEYGVMMLPKAGSYAAVGNGRNATNIGGENLFIFKTNAEEEKASWEFSKFVMSPEFQVDWAIATGYLPVCQSAENDSTYKAFLDKNEFIKVYVDQMKYGKARPSVPEYGKISTRLGKEIEKALYGKSSAKKALTKAATYAQRLLKKADR
jgi:multiple sugar transport system substrate-binding protein